MAAFHSLVKENTTPAKRRFDIIFQSSDMLIGFNDVGTPCHVTDPVVKVFKGMVYTYLCTKDGSIYSTTKLQVFEKEG